MPLPPDAEDPRPLLALRDLRLAFPGSSRTGGRPVLAVDGVSLSVDAGSTLAIVGESGSGKTTLARMVVGLATPTSGIVEFDGLAVDWRSRSSRALRRDIQMVFQDTRGSLDPRWTAGDLIAEPLRNFGVRDRDEVKARVDEVCREVGLTERQMDARPGQLSGGQRQRVGIARAIVVRPRLVVCDEPVSALDVSIRGQILELLSRLRGAEGLTYVVISHDMSIVQKLSDVVATMYLGQVVERSATRAFFQRPLHPYTMALLSAVPAADPGRERRRERIVLSGEPGDATRMPGGCRFHPRCPFAQDRCRVEVPELREIGSGQAVRCHFAPDLRIEDVPNALTTNKGAG
jgi:oligopeptide/dipeptide ABC transporter ATP-binding protein